MVAKSSTIYDASDHENLGRITMPKIYMPASIMVKQIQHRHEDRLNGEPLWNKGWGCQPIPSPRPHKTEAFCTEYDQYLLDLSEKMKLNEVEIQSVWFRHGSSIRDMAYQLLDFINSQKNSWHPDEIKRKIKLQMYVCGEKLP